MTDTESNLPIELETALRTASDERVIASFSEALNEHAKRRGRAVQLERTRRLSVQSLQQAFSMKKYILTAIITAIMVGQAYFFGVSDFVVVGFVVITAIFIYISLVKLYEGNRKMLRVYSRNGSVLHAFLSRDRTFSMRVIALFSSLILSSILVFLLKGMVLQQGYFAFFIVIVAASLILYSFINDLVLPSVVDENLHQDISAHGNEILRVFYAAIILNFILALAFSAHDTFAFKTSDVDFNNFTDKAVEKSFEKTDANHYSRIFINAYLLMDYAKVALAKVFVNLFGLHENFYGFYLVISVLNLFKMFAFSFSFVLLQKGFDGAANALVPVMRSVFFKMNTLFEKPLKNN